MPSSSSVQWSENNPFLVALSVPASSSSGHSLIPPTATTTTTTTTSPLLMSSLAETGNSNSSGGGAAGSVSGNVLTDFYIGLALAVSSSVFIGSSFIIKKKALLRLAKHDDIAARASEGGFGYLKDMMWWMGVLTMGVGEACNFAAYAFAPASLVTPLGALSVLVTAILSSRLLRERLNLLGSIGCAVCLLGSTIIVIHSPREEEVTSMADLATKMKDAGFILYVVFVVVVTLLIACLVAPRYGHSNILVYISVCSLIGSLSVLSVKGLGLAIKETLGGHQQFGNPLTYFWLVAVIGCVSVQLIYLNKSLDIYNTSMVTPIYYVFFTSFVILASSILYKEWSSLGASDIIGNLIGFLTTIIGVFQMQLFRDVNISLRQVRTLLHRPPYSLDGVDLSSSETDLVAEVRPSNNRAQIYT